jgi:glutamine synthetase
MDLSAWPQAQRVICAMSDFSAVPRGKVVDRASFMAQQGCRLSSALWGVTLSGDVVPEVLGPIVPQDFADMQLLADVSTLRQQAHRAQEIHAICEPHGPLMARADGRVIDANELSPRAALRRVLQQWQAQGLRATVAPELEFFLLQAAPGQNPPWTAARPAGHMAVQERACESNSLERLAHFDAFFDALYAGCDDLAIPITGHDHEAAFTQYEVNFAPGDALAMADAVFRFKTLVKTTAARMGFIASFMPKPFAHEPGTGMHWHISVQDPSAKDWPHVFAQPDGSDTAALAHFAAGLQHHAAAAMACFAPHDASYDRIQRPDASPTTASFGAEARDLALRVPSSGPTARRLENRLPGGDSNPYLVLAASLSLGLWGLRTAASPVRDPKRCAPLPTDLPSACTALQNNGVLREALGDTLIDAYCGTLRAENRARAAHAKGAQDWDAMHLFEGA